MRVLAGRMLGHRDTWWVEFWSALSATGWCVVAGIFSEGLRGLAAYDVLTALGPAWFWSGFGIVGPAFQLLALRRDHRVARWWAALAMTGWWLFMLFAISQAVHSTPGLALYAAWAAANWYVVVRLRTD